MQQNLSYGQNRVNDTGRNTQLTIRNVSKHERAAFQQLFNTLKWHETIG